MTSAKFFITGATGYIGGTVVSRLLAHPDAKSFELSALVRSNEKAEKLKSLGITPVLGSYNDFDVLTKAASEADIVIAMVDCDNLLAANAILAGQRQRFEVTGKAPILIHTSGTAFVMDDARGLHGDHTIYSDLQSDVIEALPETAMHRNVDIPLVNADKEGYVKTYIVTPGTVFGPISGPVSKLGIQNTKSIQLPWVLKASLDRKRGGYIGTGKNVWPGVSVQDTAGLYIDLLDAVRKDPESVGHGRDGFYFVEAFEWSLYEVAEVIGKALVELGVSEKVEPTPFEQEELEKYFGQLWPFLGTNSRARGDRSRALGWKPVDGKEAFYKDIKDQIFELTEAK